MSISAIQEKTMGKTTFVPLSGDDYIWLYETSEAQDLFELVRCPFEWIKRIQINPPDENGPRAPKLAPHYVINLDMATERPDNSGERPTYVVDGIDKTGFITVRLASPAGRFQFKSPYPLDRIERKILDSGEKLGILRVGRRVFTHLHLGTDPEVKAALLCAAIEDQDWLCRLYNQLEHDDRFIDPNGNKVDSSGRLTFTTAKKRDKHDSECQPRLEVIVQGSRPGLPRACGPKDDAGSTTEVPCCNISTGEIEGFTVTVDSMGNKAYAPIENTSPGI